MKKLPALRIENIIAYGLIALALLAHYYILLRYSSNMPIGDDYWDALRFLNNYKNTSSWHEKAGFIFAQHNEHRTTINRLVYTIMYEISGQLNFKNLMIIGDFSTIGIVALLSAQFKKETYFPYIFSLIAIFLLNLQSWSSMFWAMTAISNYSVVFFALASICALLSKRNSGLYWAILFAVCSTFSQGNGIAIWPIGFLCIFFEKNDNRYRIMIIWSLTAIACLALYFFHYLPPHSAKTVYIGWMSSFSPWRNVAVWFFAFVGSCWVFESNNYVLAASVGVLLCFTAIPAIIFLRGKSPPLAYFVLFLLLSAAIAAYSRFTFFGITAALASRYRIYSIYLSCILLISFYLFFSTKAVNQYLIKISIISIAIIHTIASYTSSFELMSTAQRATADSMRLWLLTQEPRSLWSLFIRDAGTWTEDAIDSKTWDPRGLFFDSLYFNAQKKSADCTKTDFKGNLLIAIIRNPPAAAGELVIDDTPIGPPAHNRIRRVIVCKEQQAFTADFLEPSRTIDGKLKFHFLKTDPLETADFIIFETQKGDVFKGSISL